MNCVLPTISTALWSLEVSFDGDIMLKIGRYNNKQIMDAKFTKDKGASESLQTIGLCDLKCLRLHSNQSMVMSTIHSWYICILFCIITSASCSEWIDASWINRCIRLKYDSCRFLFYSFISVYFISFLQAIVFMSGSRLDWCSSIN